ncbi:MAG: carbohydrate ABC transporter permease [Clostridia bacterium]|nr:carbohydrate ABC transporter permease [Clostridia bacterium]
MKKRKINAPDWVLAFHPKNWAWLLFRLILMIGLSYIILLPFLKRISVMFMSLDDLQNPTVWLIPQSPTWDNVTRVLKYGGYWEAFTNSLLISLSCAILQTLVCCMVGYGFAKFKFRGKTFFFLMAVFTIVIPPQTLYLALYTRFRYFDIYGLLSLFGIGPIKPLETVVPSILLSLTALGLKNGLYIFVIRQFFKGVPQELNEAAWVDGCNPIKAFFSIMFPMARSMLVSIFVLSFAWQWTDTFYSGLFNRSMTVLPMILNKVTAISTEAISNGTMMSSVMQNTAVVMIIAPLFVFYLVFQRQLIQGIERSGIVG